MRGTIGKNMNAVNLTINSRQLKEIIQNKSKATVYFNIKTGALGTPGCFN
jgi:hypothetical protein